MQLIDYVTAGGLVSLIGLVWKAGRDNEVKVTRIYSRLDEVKKDNEERYTHKDVCEILHKQISADLLEIKVDIKEIARNLNNGKK